MPERRVRVLLVGVLVALLLLPSTSSEREMTLTRPVIESLAPLDINGDIFAAIKREKGSALTALDAAYRDNHKCTRNKFLDGLSCQGRLLKSRNETNSDKRIIVAILYNGERELLWLQMNEMHLEVDQFIVVEGNVSFSGKPRRPLFDIHDPMFGRFRPKLTHSVFCATAYEQTSAQSDFKVEFMARELPTLNKTLLRDDDVLLTLDTDEIPSAGFLRLLRRCKYRKASLKMFEFFLSLQFTRKKTPSQVRACTGSIARRLHGCRRVPAVLVKRPPASPLLGTVLGKFGGKEFFYRRMMSNVNEQLRELNASTLTEKDFWRAATARPLHPVKPEDLSLLCTAVFEPSLLPPVFLHWNTKSGWGEMRNHVNRDYTCAHVFSH